MKFIRNIFLFSGIFIYSLSFSQSDNCSSATTLAVTANCSSPVAGTTAGATASISGCSGNADDDVWYKFVATATSHQITVTPSATFDPVVQLFSGTCSTLNTISCQDLGGNGVPETIYATGLTIGTTYTIRVYHYGAGSGSSTFTICLTNPPPPPANNNCAGAISLSVNAGCTYTASSSVGATQSSVGCAGTADDDVWFSFVATNSVQTITVDPSSSMDPVVQLFSGTCGALTSLYCMDNGFTNGNEVINAVGLTPGSTYYIRVYDYYSSTGGAPFDICITGTATAVPTNDEPCSAITLPAVTSACNYLNFTTIGATASTGTAPTPASCGGSSPFIGGFSATSKDVWFKITVPATGNVYITPEPGFGINDAVMALYSGACGSLTQISCSDDHNYPGSANDLKPYLAATGLTPGTTVYLRYWGYGSTSGDFGICVSSPTNDACANALYICDINGYSASTSAAYTPDRPCNMFGNNETSAGVDQPDGTNTGGIFGQGGAWGVGSPFYDVNINNNSWIKFTAAATTASLNVVIGNCWVGNYPSGGIQMQIFSGTNCCSFIPVSDFKENSTGFTITANGLTVGQTYYLMVDGFAGDICNYTITANSGVSFPAITASTPSICYSSAGSNTVTLTGPVGATSYEWSPGGQTTQVITVAPSTTTTYTCIVEGVCGYKQTLTQTVVVNPLPATTINSGIPPSICNTQTVTLSATGANTYVWNTTATTSSISVSPSSNTTYTVTGTNTGTGCTATATVLVTVNPLPTITVNSPAICSGQTIALTSNGAVTTSSYSWSTGTSGTNTISVSPASSTTYTVIGTSANSCTNTAVASVTVNSLPSISVNSVTICNGQTAILNAAGAASSTSYNWSNGINNINTISVSPGTTTTYIVTGTGANTCSNTTTANVTVNPLPVINVNSGSICEGQNMTLTATGGNTYLWNTGASGPSISVSPAGNTSYTVTGTDGNSCVNTAVAAITVNTVPAITTTPTSSPSACGLSTGSLTGASASGSGTLSYSWTNSSNVVVGTSADLTNQPAGVYNLTVTSTNGCSSVFGPYNITNPGAPSPPIVTANDTVICVGEMINLNASSPDPLPTFNWTGPNSSSTSSNLNIASATLADDGIYSVTVTSNNCTSAPFLINITVNPLPLANATSSNSPFCSDSTIYLIASGGNTYSWTGPNGFTSFIQNPAISPATTLMTGTYTVVVTDNNGCSSSDTTYLLVNQTPPIPIASSDASNYCEGEMITFTSSAPGGTSYSWSGPNGFTSTSQNPFITNSSVLQSGVYSVFATASGCSSSSGLVNVTVSSNPSATATDSASIVCAGIAINLFSSGGSIYSWTGPNSFSSANQNPVIGSSVVNDSGTYNVIVTNAAGCSDTANVSVLVNPTPATPVANAAATTICEGQNITLTSTSAGAINYSWTGPNGFISSNQDTTILNATILNGGTYSVVASAGACYSAAANVTVNVNSNPVAIAFANDSTVCSGDTINLNATGGGTYSWIGPGGYTDSVQNPSVNNSVLSNSGIYTVIVTNPGGCSDTANVSVLVNPTPATPSVNAAATNLCEGQDIILTSTSAGAVSYNWWGPNGFSSTSQNPSILNATVSESGIYIVNASSGSCTSTDTSITINVYPVPVATASANDTVFCSGDVINLSATGLGNYLWNGPAGFVSTSQNPVITSSQISDGGTYTVIVTSPGGCSDTAAVSVLINQTPASPIVTGDTTCNGGPLLLSASGTGTINWYSDANLTNLVQGNSLIYGPVLGANTTGTYYVTSSANGCTSNVSTANAYYYDVIAGATANPNTGFIPLSVSFTNLSSGVDPSDSFIWSIGTTQFDSSFNSSYIFTDPGNYAVTLIITENSSGCTDTAMLNIFADGEISYTIPNIFTPNEDHVNDEFTIISHGIVDIKCVIYDRWGLKMYEFEGVHGRWDGRTTSGVRVPDGTYFYLFHATDVNGKEHKANGPVMIMR